MYILDSIYRGDITPKEKTFRKGTEYAKFTARLAEDGENIIDELAEKGKDIFKSYEYHQSELNFISDQEAFIEGVRFGARFILDIINPAESQFSYIGA